VLLRLRLLKRYLLPWYLPWNLWAGQLLVTELVGWQQKVVPLLPAAAGLSLSRLLK
jgi:hypothetical protein